MVFGDAAAPETFAALGFLRKTTHFLWHLLQIRVFLAPLASTSKAGSTFREMSCLAPPSPATSGSTFLATYVIELQRLLSAYL